MMVIVSDERNLIDEYLPVPLGGEDELVLGFDPEEATTEMIDQVRDAASKGADRWKLEALVDKLLGIPQTPSQ